MKFRCYNRNNKDYKNYGERGINICNEWLNNPRIFCNWAYKNGYQKGLTIERVDNNKGYSPNNSIFVTRAVQANNKRNNIMINYDNENLSLKNFCRKYNLNYQTTIWRYNHKYSINELLLTK